MKFHYGVVLAVLLVYGDVGAQECASILTQLESDEKAYDVVAKLKVGSKTAKRIIDRFVVDTEHALKECTETMNADVRYTVQNKLKKARQIAPTYYIRNVNELRNYAHKNPPRKTIIRYGRILPSRQPR